MHNEFSTTLSRMLKVANKSASEVAWLSGVDSAYLTRLLSGEKHHPSPETIMKLWLGIVTDSAMIRAHPIMTHGLAELLEAAAITAAALKETEKRH